ncbi:MAG: RNA polymerase sigma factor [Flavobacteriales bacterium]
MQQDSTSHTLAPSKTALFTSLVDQLSERVYWVVRKMVLVHEDANDVTQEVFLKVWRNLDKFKGESTHSTWVHRIAVNESLNFLDKKKRRLSTSSFNEHLFSELKADVYFDGDEQVLKLHKALLTLPEKQRLVFNLKYFEDKKYSEIAEITQTSEGALKASYHLAVKKIKAILEHE